jgi:mycothiol S-conjugate amidase
VRHRGAPVYGVAHDEHRGADQENCRARGVGPGQRPCPGGRCSGAAHLPGTVGRVSEQLCLLTVHAHPDDEASKGAATVALYHDQGVRTVLVCCTGGEEGDILNPAMDTPEVRADLPAIRMGELAAAAAAIGYDEVVLLGFRDSGMPDLPANENPECFARVPLDEAAGRLVEVIRRERPQVIVTYDEDQSGYPHPDHLRVHEISMAAFEAAADPAAYPEAGPPWQPLKLYYVGFSGERIMALHAKFVELGLESPFDEGWLERARTQQRVYTTRIDVSGYGDVRRNALLAHATQIDPESPFWFGLPPEVARTVHPIDEYVLARTAPAVAGATAPAQSSPDVPTPAPGRTEGPEWEDDLFAGVREAVNR